jgi:hypothetical protein
VRRQVVNIYKTMPFLVLCVSGCLKQYTTQQNEAYLRSIGWRIIEYHQKFGSLPVSIDECIDRLSITLSHRGDVAGSTLLYYAIGGSSFVLRSVGKNGVDDCGTGDDVELLYLNGEEVSRDVMLEALRKERPSDSLSIRLSIIFGPEYVDEM